MHFGVHRCCSNIKSLLKETLLHKFDSLEVETLISGLETNNDVNMDVDDTKNDKEKTLVERLTSITEIMDQDHDIKMAAECVRIEQDKKNDRLHRINLLSQLIENI